MVKNCPKLKKSFVSIRFNMQPLTRLRLTGKEKKRGKKRKEKQKRKKRGNRKLKEGGAKKRVEPIWLYSFFYCIMTGC